jgi:hypothetical protein
MCMTPHAIHRRPSRQTYTNSILLENYHLPSAPYRIITKLSGARKATAATAQGAPGGSPKGHFRERKVAEPIERQRPSCGDAESAQLGTYLFLPVGIRCQPIDQRSEKGVSVSCAANMRKIMCLTMSRADNNELSSQGRCTTAKTNLRRRVRVAVGFAIVIID